MLPLHNRGHNTFDERVVVVGCSDSLGVVSGASHTTNLKGIIMDNNSVAVVEKQAPFRSIVEQLTTLGVSKDYKNGGGSVRWKNKQEFKKEYLAKPENKLASSRDITLAFNAYTKTVGETARRQAVAFFSNPDVLVMGGRQNKDASKGAVNYQRKSSLKVPKDNRKATLSQEQVDEAVNDNKFTKADLEKMLDAIATKLDNMK